MEIYTALMVLLRIVLISSNGLLQRKPDLIVSGINRGGNLGDDVTYSGTVSLHSKVLSLNPIFAISQVADDNYKFETAARFALQLALMIKEQSLPADVLECECPKS